MHSLDKLDPDWTFAQNHGLANRAGLPPTHSDAQQNIQLCPCCHEYINKQPLSLWQNSKQLQFLGFGFPLFYQFLKLCIILLALAICSYNAMSLQQAIQSNYSFCHKSTDSADNNASHRMLAGATTDPATKIKVCYTFLIQLSRIQDDVTNQQQAIRIVSFVLHLLALLYIRNRIIKLQAYYDERTTSLSDYTITIKGLPKKTGIQNLMRDFFKKQFKKQYQIQQITLLPEYDDIYRLIQQRNKVINQLRPHYEKQAPNNVTEQSRQLEMDLVSIQRNISAAAMETKSLAEKDELLCEKMICVFNTEQQKEDILEEFQQISLLKKREYFGEECQKTVKIKQAPQPQEIIWHNANIPKRKRLFYIALGWGLSVIVLAAVFAIFYFVLEAKSLHLVQAIVELHDHPDQQKYKTKYRGALTLVYLMMFLIVIFDKVILSTLFHKFTYLERPTTASRFQFSFALKLCLGLFFTTALMTLAVQAIRFDNYYSHPYGVIDEQTIMFFMNSFFVPFFWLVNPMRIARQIKRKLNHGKRSLTQFQANMLMQEDHYDMGKRFAQILEMMWFTFLYSTLIPIGAVLTCAGLLFYYWVDKYNLLRRSSVSGQVSGQIINLSLTLLDFTLILRPAGTLIFDSQIRHEYKPSTIIMVICAFTYIILPKDKLIEIFNDEKFRLQTKTYKQMKNVFHKTYHTEHPVYRFIHKQKFTQRLLKKGLSFGAGSIDKSSLQLISEPAEIVKNLKSSTEIDLGMMDAGVISP